MKIFPYAQFSLQTNQSAEELLTKLGSHLEDTEGAGDQVIGIRFHGNLRGNHFNLKQKNQKYEVFYPILKGICIQNGVNNTQTRIQITTHTPFFLTSMLYLTLLTNFFKIISYITAGDISNRQTIEIFIFIGFLALIVSILKNFGHKAKLQKQALEQIFEIDTTPHS